MEERDEQDAALELLRQGKHAFLTGPAGTGKSYLCRRFLEACDEAGKDVLVTATTGVAAMILGGQTLHSAVGLPVLRDAATPDEDDGCGWASHAARSPKATARAFLRHRHEPDPDPLDSENSATVLASYKARSRDYFLERLRRADALVLDEVSMLDARTMDHASWLVASARRDDRPFGGLQVVLVGDLAQLPPVEGDRWGWAPDSAAWRELAPATIALKQVRRQADPAFAALLGRLRFGALAADDARSLLARVGAFDPRGSTRVLPTNRECDAINARELAALPGVLRASEARDFVCDERLSFLLKRFDDGCPSPKTLRVKVGARVLITVNDEVRPARYANGTAATVVEVGVLAPPGEVALQEAKRTRKRSSLYDVASGDVEQRGVLLELESGEVVWVARHTWTIEEHGRVLASREQFPMRLGWAITAHRAQGCTLARASVSLERCFTEGQAYVSLSRVKSIEGLNLESARLGMVAAHPRFLRFERERAGTGA